MQKATREQIKEHNRRLVLKTVYDHSDMSRADVARATRLTRTTVSDIVTELINTGLLEEVGIGSSAGGKPPILLGVVDDARQLVCVDLSDDYFQGALVNLRGKIAHRNGMSIDCQEDQDTLACIFEIIDELLEAATAPLIGIGIGSPGLIDSQAGIVREAVNLGWKDLPLKKVLSERYHLPIYIANDSHVAALAEFTFGELRGTPNLAVLKVGRGIGSGILLNGQIFYGDGFSAGEIGHLRVVENGVQCRCGNYGCLETVSSTRAILMSLQKDTYLQPISLDTAFDAYRSGDERAQDILQRAGLYLGIAIADLVSILNINNIVLSGNLAGFGTNFLELVHRKVKNRVLAKMADETRLSYSALGQDNVILGASALVLSKELGLI
ncbi:MAG TPA: ROK family transcriptional regulator [Anaerolineales bacterium]